MNQSPPILLAKAGVARLLLASKSNETKATPLLFLPSPITRWGILQPRCGPSLFQSLSNVGFRTYCLDWGEPIAQDRELTWDDLVLRIGWARDQILRDSGCSSLGLLGFSLGGTLAVISAAIEPAAMLVNIAGPIDFQNAGFLFWLSRTPCFDPSVPANAFRATPPVWMQAALMAHRAGPARWWLDHFGPCVEASSPPLYEWMETMAQHHVPLPPNAFTVFVRQLVKQNQLLRGRHHVAGHNVDLQKIRCPVLAIGAKQDAICHPHAVTVLADATGSNDATAMLVPGGHLGSIVGRNADRSLHDPIVRWLLSRDRTRVASCS